MWLKAIFLVTFSFQFCYSFPDGSGTSACPSLMPSHSGIESQNIPAPYSIEVSSMFVLQGEALNLTISSNSPGIFFRGFSIQARTLENTPVVTGTFLETEIARGLNCANFQFPEFSTVTHRTNADKSQIELTWTAPSGFDDSMPMNFHFTLVQSHAIFWVGIQSPIFIVMPNPDGTATPPTPPTVPNTTPPPEQIEVYEGCGETKVCFGSPLGCIQSRNCHLFGAVIFDNENFTFELLSSPGQSYIAMALSDDDRMGSDSVIECVNENNNIQTFTSYTHIGITEEDFRSSRADVGQNIIRLVSSRFIDGRIYCQVQRNTVSNVPSREIHLIDQEHFLLLASGVSLRQDGIGSHGTSRAYSNQAYNLTIPVVVEPGRRVLPMVHGSLMIVAWFGAASIGIFIARYFKETWKGQKACGNKDIWFVCHFICMLITWTLTIAAFIIIFVEVGAWRTSVHSVTGTITMVLVFIQPIGAVFRPKPTHPKRPIFNFAHFAGGNIAYLLATITILFSVPLPAATVPYWTSYVIVGYIVFHLFMHLTMTAVRISGGIKRAERPEKPNKNQPYPLLSKTILGFYILTALLFVIALILIIVLQP